MTNGVSILLVKGLLVRVGDGVCNNDDGREVSVFNKDTINNNMAILDVLLVVRSDQPHHYITILRKKAHVSL